jgi:hypothetical protein
MNAKVPNRPMTTEDGRAFKRRWQLVNQMEIEELRQSAAETRLRQFFTLQSWTRSFGWQSALEEGLDEVRRRWALIRKRYRA